MNWLIISSHPNPESFTQAMVKAASSAIHSKDKKRIINLYDTEFNPLLNKYEFIEFPKKPKDYKIAKDIQEQLDNIIWSDRIIFIYPIWWMQMPALLKGYFDRVFYHAEILRENTNLYEKRVISFVGAGLSNSQQVQKGIDKAYTIILNDFFYFFTGRKGFLKVYGNVNNTDDDTRRDYLEDIKNIVKTFSNEKEK